MHVHTHIHVYFFIAIAVPAPTEMFQSRRLCMLQLEKKTIIIVLYIVAIHCKLSIFSAPKDEKMEEGKAPCSDKELT